MTDSNVLQDFRKKVCGEIEIEAEGLNRYIVYTPFMFDDGDHFVTVLKRENGGWQLTDEGHTLMHLSYTRFDFDSGTRKEVIERAASLFGLENRHGEFTLCVPEERFGDALFSFSQALMKIADTTYWTKERVSTTFYDDLRALLAEKLDEFNPQFDYTDPVHDANKTYSVDCYLNGKSRPILIFGIKDEMKCLQSSIGVRQFVQWGYKTRSIGIFEDMSKISSKKLPAFTDVADKQYSSLQVAETIRDYVSDLR